MGLEIGKQEAEYNNLATLVRARRGRQCLYVVWLERLNTASHGKAMRAVVVKFCTLGEVYRH